MTSKNASSDSDSSEKMGLHHFRLLTVIGKGSYGTVILVSSRIDKGIYAMKILRKQNIMERKQVEHTKTERSVLEVLNHNGFLNCSTVYSVSLI